MNGAFREPAEYEEEAAMPYRPEDASASEPAMHAVVGRHEPELLAIDGVEGVGIGQDDAGHDAIVIYIRDESTAERVPDAIDDYPVQTVVTGEISAY